MADLLASLKAERERHYRVAQADGRWCRDCGHLWPCDMSRALDCAIAGAEALRLDGEGHEASRWVRDALEAMSRAWEWGDCRDVAAMTTAGEKCCDTSR